jgi:hypothetical protein
MCANVTDSGANVNAKDDYLRELIEQKPLTFVS